jgi:hypothetical protein
MSDQLHPDRLREVLLKLEVTQFAKGELHAVKEELRELLARDLSDQRREAAQRNRRVISIVVTIGAILIGGDIWTVWHTINRVQTAAQDAVNKEIVGIRERSHQALQAEVLRIQQGVSQRLDQEFATPRIRQLVEEKARDYTRVEAQSYIAGRVEEGLKPLHQHVENYKARIDQAYDELAQQREIASLGDEALAGSRQAYDRLLAISREHTSRGQKASQRLTSVIKSFSVYLKPDIGSALVLTFQTPEGKTLFEKDLSASELFGTLSKEVDLPEDRRRVMGYLVQRPKEQLIAPALAILRQSTYLPGIAATCGILRSAFGGQAGFLDIDGWSRFLEKKGAAK